MFKDLKGFEGLYQVNEEGEVLVVKKDKLLRPALSKKGYIRVTLSKQGRRYSRTVHRLVAETFIPNPLDLFQINHIDGDKTNNCKSNLEWCSASQNIKHAHDNGLMDNSGENHSQNKLRAKDIDVIRRLKAEGVKQSVIARAFSVSDASISNILLGKNWRNK